MSTTSTMQVPPATMAEERSPHEQQVVIPEQVEQKGAEAEDAPPQAPSSSLSSSLLDGPRKIDLSEQPKSSLLRAFDAFVLFAIIHYIQIFWCTMFLFLYLYRSGIRWPLGLVVGTYLPFYLFPWQRLGGRPCKRLMLRPFWQFIQRHLRIQVEREVGLDPSRQYIFGWHPHGILLLSRFAVYGGLWDSLFPGIEQRTLAASPLFWIPPIREVSILLGGVDASKQCATRVLKDGYSVSVYPGGSREIYTTDNTTPEHTLVLKDRKGFIRLALKFGVPLVPVFVFGEKYAYNKFHHRTGFAYFVLKVLRVPFLVFWGRWGSFMPLPNTTLAVVVGKPMEVQRVESPSEEQVQAVLEEYSQQVLQLFDRHKGKYARRTDEHVVIV